MNNLFELSSKLNRLLLIFVFAFCFSASITLYTHPAYIDIFFALVIVVLLVLAIMLKADINAWSMLALIFVLAWIEYGIETYLMQKITGMSFYLAYLEKIILVVIWYKAFIYRPYLTRLVLDKKRKKQIKPLLVEGHLLRLIKYVLFPLETLMLTEFALYDLKIFNSAFFYNNYEVFKIVIFSAFFAILYHGVIYYRKGASRAPSGYLS